MQDPASFQHHTYRDLIALHFVWSEFIGGLKILTPYIVFVIFGANISIIVIVLVSNMIMRL